MPLSPEDGARLSAPLDQLVADFELHVLARLADYIATGLAHEDWSMRLLLGLHELRRQVEGDHRALTAAAQVETDRIMARARKAGADQLAADLAAAGL